MNSSSIVLFVLPSLRISGGVIETVRLAWELRSRGVDARIVSLWKHPNPLQQSDTSGAGYVPIIYLSQFSPKKWRAPFDLMFLALRYWRYLRSFRAGFDKKIPTVVLTHYSTLLFVWFTPPSQRYCFLQGEEWLFLTNGVLRHLFSRFVLFSYAHCRVITANRYLTDKLRSVGLAPVAEAPIWADACFAGPRLINARPVDLVMVLRQSYVKRLDLYLRLIAAAKKSGGVCCAVITPEDRIAAEVSELADVCLLRPGRDEMRALYQRSKVFVLLSEREGFGLPPLEAMGAGCVPVCRDSGGVRCYMKGALDKNLIPLEASLDVLMGRLRVLLSDENTLHELSKEARRIFVEGLKESEKKREQALTLLSSI